MNKNIRNTIISIISGIMLGIIFGISKGIESAAQYETAYLMEYLLSVDNLAVIAAIFAAFKADEYQQHKALNYGIAGAIIMRTSFIMVGAEALEKFSITNYIFGGLLAFSAYKMFTAKHDDSEPAMIARVRRWFPRVSMLVLMIIAVELTDVLFAIDSVPAVLSITDDRVVALASNIMAIMGLRSLFFVLKDGMDKIKYLNQTLAAILAFVGFKMIITPWVHVSTLINIIVIFVLFGFGMIASLKKKGK